MVLNESLNASAEIINMSSGNTYIMPLIIFLAADIIIVAFIIGLTGKFEKQHAISMVLLLLIGFFLSFLFPSIFLGWFG